MTLIINKVLSEDVPHEVMDYHDSDSITNMEDYVVRSTNDKENAHTIGLEIEMTKGYDDTFTQSEIDKMFELFPYAQIEYDSSIPGSGFEFITAPMTPNAYKESNFKEFLKYAIDNGYAAAGYTSTDSGQGCGGHIHIDKQEGWEDVVALMCMFLDQNKEIVQMICKRPFTGYARNNLSNLEKSIKRYNLQSVKEYVLEHKGIHENAFNLQHSKTIEFRLPIGTLNFETKMAHIEFLVNLYECCEDVVKGRARIDRLTINKVCQKGDYLPKLMKDLGISCSKKLRIMNSEFSKQIKQLEQTRKNIAKTLSKLLVEISLGNGEVRAASIRTINGYLMNVTEPTSANSIKYALNELKRQRVLSSGLDEYSNEHDDKITELYNKLKVQVSTIVLPQIDQEIREEI